MRPGAERHQLVQAVRSVLASVGRDRVSPAGPLRVRAGQRRMRGASEHTYITRSSKSVPARVDIRLRVCVVSWSSRERKRQMAQEMTNYPWRTSTTARCVGADHGKGFRQVAKDRCSR